MSAMDLLDTYIEIDSSQPEFKTNLTRAAESLKSRAAVPGLPKDDWEVIYALTDSAFWYVGRTGDVAARWRWHVRGAVNSVVRQWKRSLAERGLKFKMFLLAVTPKKSAPTVESEFIRRFKDLYGDRCLNLIVGTSENYSTEQAAKLAGVHRTTLQRWLTAGQVKASVNVPMAGITLHRWTEADVDRLKAFAAKNKWQEFGAGRGRPSRKGKGK